MQPFEPTRPPPPNISHPGIMAIDITDKFTSAVATMSPGEVVKDDTFHLYDSVSAMEIMDRKMDSGILDEDESLDEEYDVTSSVLPQEILGIIDELLCLEMAWHLGYPLSQTILTSVHVDALMNPDPATIQDVDFSNKPSGPGPESVMLLVLRAYCAGLLRACFSVNEFMKEEMSYEEEDFVTNTYGRGLLGNIPVPDIKKLLLDAIAEVCAERNGFSQSIGAALVSRLELRIAFLDALDLDTTRMNLSELPRLHWTRMGKFIDEIANQHGLGWPVPAAFSTKLQRRLTSTMPPRPMVSLGFQECISHFSRLFEDAHEVIDILQYEDPQSLLNFILLFQQKQPQPLAFIRTMLQNLMFKDMVVLGRLSIRQLLDHDVCLSVLPCGPHFNQSFDYVEAPEDPRHKIAHAMEEFRQRVAEPYLDLLCVLCQNRCRVRRLLCHHVQSWDALEQEVAEIEDRIDQHIPTITSEEYPAEDPEYKPLRSWIRFFKLRQLQWIVQLGFELRIYQPDELAEMYHCLASLAVFIKLEWNRTRRMTASREQRARKFVGLLDDDESLPTPIGEDFTRSSQYQQLMMLNAAFTSCLSEGLHLLYLALMRLGFVKRPPQPYGTDALRYELRMRPIKLGTPGLPPYELVKKEVEKPEMSTEEVLGQAEKTIGDARLFVRDYINYNKQESFSVNPTSHSYWAKSVRSDMHATISAGVAIGMLQKALKEMEDKKTNCSTNGVTLGLKVTIPESGDSNSNRWIVPTVTRKSTDSTN
ncbi:Mak10 subunit, NatC N-terminal acetyltransferase-domain-containing protein [Xylaria bambusicola]|uniref:Mak10 subunit, NatC N-terminal acetyltransferase-domain-containing protein n=1 Tax=Xylaria bambusicola TaxID=326684 RepID=UPI0020089375|nr:Mak10 subunit, NatC N-terminal acetyltransferase-domain-containing protein [Xylaria bambusicola]KAI0518480.1 Mak10 subunit, NatC N-terminal acetyltransferase-domain-containing protein [Xylaria bambusicola]